MSTCKRVKLDHYITSYAKINSKRIKDLTKIIKLFEENLSVNICQFRLGNNSIDMTTKAQATKGRTINWTSLKLTIFVLQRTLSRK